MRSILAYRYTATETLSAAIALRESLEGKHTDNPYIALFLSNLKKLEELLRESIAYHDQNNNASESDELDDLFNDLFKKLRSVVELYGDMHEFGEVATNCCEIRDVIHRHGRNLHERPKDVQISLFDSVITEIAAETIDAANVRPLFDPVVAAHNNLKELEKKRRAAVANSESIQCPSEIARRAKPIISKLHAHICDIAEIGATEYETTLTTINAKLAPIDTRVKTRKTRQENEAN